jgi:pimeloyl-ACP methyl ester carboxylesterase
LSWFLMIWIVFILVFLPACSAKTEAVVPTTVPSNTVQPLTAIIPTNTFIPPAPTIEPSVTSTQPPTEAPPTLHCEGEGSPTIVLLQGCGSPDPNFNTNTFYADLSTITQPCSYVRQTSDAPNTMSNIINDLNTRITNAQLSAPYVLVGHSCGGWVSILFAATYPEEIAGVVLLDSPHPDYGSHILEIIPTASPDEPVTLTNFRQGFIDWNSPDYPNPENWDWGTNLDQARIVTSRGDVPLLILSASEWQIGSGIPEITQHMTDDWIAQQKELAALSTIGRQVTVENTGNLMWWDNPTRLISLIKSFIQQIRTSSPWNLFNPDWHFKKLDTNQPLR